jgi:hypothetical protein
MVLTFISLFGNLLPSFPLYFLLGQIHEYGLIIVIMTYSPFFNVIMCVFLFYLKDEWVPFAYTNYKP